MPPMRNGCERGTLPISVLLGVGELPVRVQDPTIFQTEGDEARWYIKPYVDTFDENGQPTRKQQRIYLGRVSELGKREATKKKNEVMDRINKSQLVLSAQIPFGEFVDTYKREYLLRDDNLAESTQKNYEYVINRYLIPTFGQKMFGEITPRAVDSLMATLTTEHKLAWSSRMVVKGVLSGIFEQAARWGIWKERNPCDSAIVGKKKAVYEHKKISIGDTRKLLDSLQDDVRLLCETCLYCGLRISETMGLQWKHVDFDCGKLLIRQQWKDYTIRPLKTEKSIRDVVLGLLVEDFKGIYPGDGNSDEFVFNIQNKRNKCSTRCEWTIRYEHLVPAAKKLGLYAKGFGFHQFRREAVTELGNRMGSLQVQRMAGHASESMTLRYTQSDLAVQETAVRDYQETVRGKVVPIRKGA